MKHIPLILALLTVDFGPFLASHTRWHLWEPFSVRHEPRYHVPHEFTWGIIDNPAPNVFDDDEDQQWEFSPVKLPVWGP
jgi:hypothetical protein